LKGIYQGFGITHLRYGPEKQADKYYDELISNCQKLRKIQKFWEKTNEGISMQLLGIKAISTYIFYRTLSENYVEITRIFARKKWT